MELMLTTVPAPASGIFIHDDAFAHAEVIHVFGDATFADAPRLDEMLGDLSRAGRPIVLDLRECRSIDCATIGVLVRRAKALRDNFRLAVPSRARTRRMFELTGLTDALHLHETFDSALRAFGPLTYPPLRLV